MKTRVKRLDGRMTPVDLDTLEYRDMGEATFVEYAEEWDGGSLSQVHCCRLYLHPDFQFIAESTCTQYRGAPRPGDTSGHPMADREEIIQAFEIEPGADPAAAAPPPPGTPAPAPPTPHTGEGDPSPAGRARDARDQFLYARGMARIPWKEVCAEAKRRWPEFALGGGKQCQEAAKRWAERNGQTPLPSRRPERSPP